MLIEELLIQAEILWPALVAGLLVLVTHVPLGREVLQRGIIFLDLAIAQMAAFGVVVANVFIMDHHGHGHAELSQTMIAVITAIIGSLGLYSLRNVAVKVQEAIIGILFILAATGSLLLLSADPNGGEKLKDILIGQILWFQASDLLPLFIVYASILFVWCALRDKLGAWVFYPLFAITITLSTQVVGVYLVFASLIIPSLATLKASQPIVKGLVIGVLGYSSGLVFSALLDLPAGAAIVWCLAIVAFIYYLFGLRRL